jgi:hypothetical protein
VVEGARLESAYTAKNRIVGSNPTPSAKLRICLVRQHRGWKVPSADNLAASSVLNFLIAIRFEPVSDSERPRRTVVVVPDH